MTWMEKQIKEETTLLNVKNPQSVCHDSSIIESLQGGGLSEKSKGKSSKEEGKKNDPIPGKENPI